MKSPVIISHNAPYYGDADRREYGQRYQIGPWLANAPSVFDKHRGFSQPSASGFSCAIHLNGVYPK